MSESLSTRRTSPEDLHDVLRAFAEAAGKEYKSVDFQALADEMETDLQPGCSAAK
jgi:hypothetical protein